MIPPDPMELLRRQRNLAAILAVSVVLAGFAVTFPGSLAYYRSLRNARAEVVDLQRQIVDLQNQIRESQRNLREIEQQLVEARRK